MGFPRLARASRASPVCDKAPALDLSGAVPVHNFDFVACFQQSLADIFGNHHRAMLSARASEADGQVALALANVVRQQVDQQFRDAVDELLRLWKRPDVLGDSR